MWQAMLADIYANTPPAILSARFHNGIAALSRQLCLKIRTETGCNTVALSGGVWQNQLLLQNTTTLLAESNFDILLHKQVPTNDGGLALGQLLIAGHQVEN